MSRRARKYRDARPWETHGPDDDRDEISRLLDELSPTPDLLLRLALPLIVGLAPLGTPHGGDEATDAHDASQNEIEREMRAGEVMR